MLSTMSETNLASTTMADLGQSPFKPFSKIPLEVFFIISDLLPLHSRIAFALTCKTLSTRLFPTRQFPPLSKRDLTKLLLLLEKDVRGRYLCFGCTQLRFDDKWPQEKHERCEVFSFRRGDQEAHTKLLGSSGQLARFPDHPKRSQSRMIYSRPIREVCWRRWHYGLELTFSEVHAVMNRHFYGQSHGLDIKSLEKHFEFERFICLAGERVTEKHYPLDQHRPGKRYLTRSVRQAIVSQNDNNIRCVYASHGWVRPNLGCLRTCQKRRRTEILEPADPLRAWRFVHMCEAKIIQDELYLAYSHTVNGPSATAMEWGILLENIDLPLCPHLCCNPFKSSTPVRHGDRMYFHGPYCIPPVYNSANGLRDCRNLVGSCQYCYTDYKISIKKGDASSGRSLELITYHRLGSCRSIHNPFWTYLTSMSDYANRYKKEHEVGPGSVWETWHENGEMNCDGEPEWGPADDYSSDPSSDETLGGETSAS